MQYVEPLKTCDTILHLFSNETAIYSTTIYEKCGGKNNHIVTNAIEKLMSDGYLKTSGNSHFMLGGEGILFINNGGYAGLCEQYRIEQLTKNSEFEEERELAELNKEKIKIDIKNAKRIYKTYWFTFIIALGGFLISMILLILKFIGQTK